MFHGPLDYFQKPPLRGRLNTKPREHGTPNAHNCWFISFYHVWGSVWIKIHWNSICWGLGHIWLHTTPEDPWPHYVILEVPCNALWTLSFGLSQYHGHGSWLMCEVGLNVNPTLFVIHSKFFLEDYVFTVLQELSLTKWFFIQFSIIHDNISSQLADKRRERFGQCMNTSIIMISPILKKCHPKSYSSDIEYHTTLNIIFSVASMCLSSYIQLHKWLEYKGACTYE